MHARSTVFLGPIVSDDVHVSPRHFCMAGHLPTGGSRLSPGSTISPGAILPLLVALRSQILDHTSLPQFSDRHYRGVFIRDLLMLLCGLHHFWIGYSILCMCLRRFVAGCGLLADFSCPLQLVSGPYAASSVL
jgi:hypothetical protein